MIIFSSGVGMYFPKTWTKFQPNILRIQQDVKVESGFAVKRTRTHNGICKSTYVQKCSSKLHIKTMLRNVRKMLFSHNIAHTSRGKWIFIVYQKNISRSIAFTFYLYLELRCDHGSLPRSCVADVSITYLPQVNTTQCISSSLSCSTIMQ